MKILLTGFLILLAFHVFAQKTPIKSTIELGPLATFNNYGMQGSNRLDFGGEIIADAIFKRIGIGAGVQVVKFKDAKSVYVPVFLDLRVYFNNDDLKSFFLELEPGYGIHNSKVESDYQKSESKGGFFFSGGFGFYFDAKSEMGPYLSLKYARYNIHRVTTSGIPYTQKTEVDRGVNGFTIGIGVWFK